MYESPITKIVGDIAANIVKREEDYLMESVHKVGFDIDKEELVKALQYDRDQYEKGFKDGRLSAEPRWIPVTERLPEEYGEFLVTMTEKAKAKDLGFDIDETYIRKMRYNSNGWQLPRHIPSWINEAVKDEVLAWMPLPEPYKEDDDDALSKHDWCPDSETASDNVIAWAELHAPYVNEEPPTDGCYGCKHRIIRSVPTSKFYCDLDDAFHDNLTNCPLEQDAPSASELRGEEYWADQGDEE